MSGDSRRVCASGKAKVAASKHKAVKREYNGMTFDSGRELKRWQELELLLAAGKIAELQRQVPFVLAGPVVLGGRKKPAIKYVADFAYWDLQGAPTLIVEDAKSPHLRTNQAYRIKKHLMMSEHGIEIEEV